MRVCFVLGTRPEIIKLAPVIHRFREAGVATDVVHTGQHYSYSLNESFFEVLGLSDPDFHLDVGSDSHGAQTGAILEQCESIFQNEEYDLVVVQGDTNSTLGGGLAAVKLPGIDIAHVEAGLRSFDLKMPEEINRKITDVCSDLYFVPTEETAKNLRNEGITDGVHVVGNTVVDAVLRHSELARERSTVLSDLGVDSDEFILFTGHRQENVDDERVFTHIVDQLSRIGEERTVIYPIHPRAEERAREFGIYGRLDDAVDLVDPLPYLDFLSLEDNAKIVITDSGGVQEEAIVLGTPCITIRDTTERPETVREGGNLLVDPDGGSIYETYRKVLEPDRYSEMKAAENPFGDGTTSDQILTVCQERYE